MSLDERVQDVRDQLLALGAGAGGAVEEAAGRLALALEPAIRLTLQRTLTDAADSLREQLREVATVEVRLEAGEPVLLAVPLPPSHAPETPADGLDLREGASPSSSSFGDPPTDEGEAGAARFTLRLPQHLKTRIDAGAATEGVSVNTWLTRAAERALAGSGGRRRSGNSLTGWIG